MEVMCCMLYVGFAAGVLCMRVTSNMEFHVIRSIREWYDIMTN